MNALLKEGYQILVGNDAMARIMRDYNTVVGSKMMGHAPADFTPGRYEDKSKGFTPGSHIVNGDGDIFFCVDATETKANWLHVGNLADHATEGSYARVGEELVGEDAGRTNGSPSPKKESREETSGGSPGPESPDSGDSADGSDKSSPEPESEEEKPETLAGEDPIEPEQADQEVPDEKKPTARRASEQAPEGEATEGGFRIGPDSSGRESYGPDPIPIPDDMPWSSMLTEKNNLVSIQEVAQYLDTDQLHDLPYMNPDRAKSVAAYIDENYDL